MTASVHTFPTITDPPGLIEALEKAMIWLLECDEEPEEDDRMREKWDAEK